MTKINVTVDGISYADEVEPRTLLVHYLREQLGKVGTVVGCDTSNCGACTVSLDGQSVKSCSVLAVQADGSEVTTIEGLAAEDGTLHPVQQAFHDNHALQCGFCTPGMIMAARDLLQNNPNPTEAEIREGIEGNLCRCTGYQNIVRAVQAAAGSHEPDRRPVMTAVADAPAAEIGQSRPRKEDQHLITGRTTWTDNMTLPGMVHLAILRSPMAHATITSIDTSEAKPPRASSPSSPARTSPTRRATCPARGRSPPTWSTPVRRAWPSPRSTTSARRSPSSPPATRPRRRTRSRRSTSSTSRCRPCWTWRPRSPSAPLVHPNTTSNRSYTWAFESGAAGTGAPIDDALADAEVTVKRRFIQQRLIPAFMEPRSTVVQPLGEGVTMWSSTQIPHILRTMLALTLGIPEQKVRVIAPDVGGGFGGKLQVTPEEVITVLVARKLGKPAKYTESRSGVADGGAPRPRPDPGHHDHRQARRHGHRPRRPPARRHGRLPAAW